MDLIATGGGWRTVVRRALAVAWAARRADALLLNCAVTDALVLSAMLPLVGARCRLFVSDPVMNPPHGAGRALRAAAKRRLLRRVDRFLVHQRDLVEYARLYGITPARSTYVPFKVNLLDVITTLPRAEGDYVFSCGVTNRDWPTLGAATRALSQRIVVSMPDAAQLRRMGAIGIAPRREDFGPNATFVENGADPREWLELAAGARLVVLPVTADAINPSGVSTYLSIMALGKCVVISDGPATREVITDEAIVVPPGDPVRLRQAIVAAWSNDELRRATAARGQTYAGTLGGSDRLMADLAAAVVSQLDATPRPARR